MGLSKRSQTSVLLLLHSQMPSPSSSRDGNAAAISGSTSARNFFCDADGSLAQRRLTRQRKLRHVTDHELGLYHGHGNLTDQSQSRSRSSPASPESSRKLRSPARDHRSFSAVPQPLPLPSARRDVDQTATTSRLCHVGANAGDMISCCHAAEDGLKTRASFPSRSAPTSPAASPRRTSPGGDRDAPKLAAKTGAAAARTQKAVSFPVCYKNWLPAEASGEASHAGAHPLPLPPGAVGLPAKGQWQKGKLIGRGTFGSVYLGTNRETGALCAMKEVDLFPDDPKSVECIRQLEQEIEMLRQLKHPNIVQYYGSEVVDDHFYIYLEFVYPGSINKYVREHVGAVTESVVRNFTRHILSGLAYLHSRKTVHRDIKGANLLVDASGAVKLADFGMAKLLTGQSYDLSLKGSPYWMAPEVIKAAMQRNASPYLALAVDIWSLGCTIIEMINGRPPWSEFTGPQAMFKVLNTTPPIPETLSSEGKDFLSCCFRRNPLERPPAAKLLEHPFVRNLHHQSTSPTTHISSVTNVMEKLHIQRDRGKHKFDLAPVSPRARAGNSNESPPYGGNTSSPWTLSL